MTNQDKKKEFEAALEKTFSNLNDKDVFKLDYVFDVDELIYRIIIIHLTSCKCVRGKVDFEMAAKAYDIKAVAEKTIEDMLATLKEAVDEESV